MSRVVALAMLLMLADGGTFVVPNDPYCSGVTR